MKTKTLTIPMDGDKLTVLADPMNPEHTIYNGFVRIGDLPFAEVPTEINPRALNLNSRIVKKIRETLEETPSIFHLLNRGLTILVKDAKYDSKKKQLILEVPHKDYGLIDGLHSMGTIRDEAETAIKDYEEQKKELKEKGGDENLQLPEFLNSFIKMEVITGISGELSVSIANSRNSSIQVKEQSLLNLSGEFDWLKKLFSERQVGFAGKIAYRENENQPIDVREIVSLMTLFHPNYKEVNTPPMLAYSSRGKCLDLFADIEGQKGYRFLEPIIIDILRLYDHTHLKWPEVYEAIGGVIGSAEEEDKRKTKEVKLARVVGIKRFKEGFGLHYSEQKAEFYIPDGFLYPIVSAFRGIVNYSGEHASWKTNPFEFFNKVSQSMIRSTLDTAKSVGKRPSAVSKFRPHWESLMEKVVNVYLTGLEKEQLKKAA